MPNIEEEELDDDLLKDMVGDAAGIRQNLSKGPARYKVPEDGKTHRLRIVPGTYGKSKRMWTMQNHQHWIPRIGKRDMAVTCPMLQVIGGKPLARECEWCSFIEKMKVGSLTADAAKTLAKMGIQIGSDMVVIDREEETLIWRVYSAPSMVLKSWMDGFVEGLKDRVNIFDPNTGRDVWVKKVKKDRSTEYTSGIVTRQSTLIDSGKHNVADWDEVVDSVPNLEAALLERLDQPQDFDSMVLEVRALLDGKSPLKGKPSGKPSGGGKPSRRQDEDLDIDESGFDQSFGGGDDGLPEAPDLDIDDEIPM